MVGLVVAARVLLVAVFATAGIAKARDQASTRRSVIDFGVPDRLAPVVAVALVAAELATGALLCWSASARLGGGAALVLLGVFCAAAAANLVRGRAPECNCFGQVHSQPVGPGLLVRNACFAVAALVVVVGAASAPGPSLWGWATDLSAAEASVVAVVAALALAVVVLALRLRSVEAAQREVAEAVARLRREVVADRPQDLADDGGDREPGPGLEDEPPVPAAPQFAPGLPVGSVAPAFSLASGEGLVTLADLLVAGKPLVLFFVAPTCATCHELLPKPARWAASYGDVLTFALVTAGSPQANEGIAELAGGFEPILFDPGPTRQAYEVAATPGGVLVDRNGTIETETVYGVADILMLVMRAAAAERARLPPVR